MMTQGHARGIGWRQRLLIGTTAGALLLGAMPALAQEATPPASPAAGAPCATTPTTPERLIAALEASTSQPLTELTIDALPTGTEVERATAKAIRGTVRESVDCRNAGQFGSVYALFSDAMIGRLLGTRDTIPPEVLEQLNQIMVIRPQYRVRVEDVSGIIQLADGRVGALVATRNATHSFTDYLFFVEQDGVWLIDEAVSLAIVPLAADGTPTP